MERIESGLKNKKVVVLGGSSGIGLEMAQLAQQLGAEVVIASSHAERVKQAIVEIGGKTTGQALDLFDEVAIEEFFDKLGPLDQLVYTAADSLHVSDLATTDLKAARKAFDLRYRSALAAVKYATPHIRKDGAVTLTTGVYGQRPIKGIPIIASIAAMMEGLTRSLAIDLAPIRVNCVSPGVVRTKLWDSMPKEQREAFFETTAKQMLVGRIGEPAEIAQTYLCLMQQGYSTGQTVIVDGGTMLV
jgi:NAD(P)-dependent dehydrogenase (short-subunit alcohol dehydrogenase family)